MSSVCYEASGCGISPYPLNLDELCEIILAANYIDCQSLLKLGTLKLATIIKDKTPEEIQNIIDVYPTPEEEEKLKLENEWVFTLGENL